MASGSGRELRLQGNLLKAKLVLFSTAGRWLRRYNFYSALLVLRRLECLLQYSLRIPLDSPEDKLPYEHRCFFCGQFKPLDQYWEILDPHSHQCAPVEILPSPNAAPQSICIECLLQSKTTEYFWILAFADQVKWKSCVKCSEPTQQPGLLCDVCRFHLGQDRWGMETWPYCTWHHLFERLFAAKSHQHNSIPHCTNVPYLSDTGLDHRGTKDLYLTEGRQSLDLREFLLRSDTFSTKFALPATRCNTMLDYALNAGQDRCTFCDHILSRTPAVIGTASGI